MKKILLALLVTLSLSLVFSTFNQIDNAEAAAKTMYVNAKDDIKLRATADKNGKHLGSIKNKTAIKVLSISKGWAYVDTGKKKGYVYASALSNTNPNIPVVTGGLTPKAGLKLTYSPGFSSYLNYDVKQNRDTYIVSKDGDGFTYLVNDNSEIYYTENYGELRLIAESSWVLFNFKYPMKHGKYTTQNIEEGYGEPIQQKALVESTNKTVKVKAGTYKNVVIIKTKDNYRYYFAKDLGLIKLTNPKGKALLELESVK